MTNGVKVGIVAGLVGVAIGVTVWRFGGLARATRSAKPYLHRARAESCSPTRPPGTPQPTGGTCRSDADCTAGKNGRCSPHGNGRLAPANRCTYDTCFTDADCGGQGKGTCTCDPDGNYCLSGNCRVDADCGPRGSCSPSFPMCSLHGPYRPVGYFCHTAGDECTNDDDCPKPRHKGYGYMSTKCTYSAPLGRWTCTSEECPVG
jgi:hypothetical protein